MNPPEDSVAFGAPGIEPRWTSSAKEGVGTAYHTQLPALVHAEPRHYQRDLLPACRSAQHARLPVPHHRRGDLLPRGKARPGPPDRIPGARLRLLPPDQLGTPGPLPIDKARAYRSAPSGLARAYESRGADEALRGKLRLYALLAPHIARYGAGNSGCCSEIGGANLIHAQREGVHLVMACSTGFSRRSVGYVGASDGWQDLMGNFKMDWEFRTRREGQHRADRRNHAPGQR